MLKLVSATIALSCVAMPAIAESASHPLDFERNGIHYVGSIIDVEDGAKRIVGHEVQSGRDFALLVKEGRVTGRYDGQPVSYAAPRGAAGAVLASAAPL